MKKGALVAGQGPADPLTDARLLEDVQFSMLKGQRYKASCQMLTDDVRMRTLLFLAIAIEPLRYLSGWWMRRAREADRPGHSPPSSQMPVDCATVPGNSVAQPRWPGQTGAGLTKD